MGAKLAQYYDLAEKRGGATMKTRLVLKTGITSVKASSDPDTPDALAKVFAAAKEVIGPDVPQL